MLADSTPAPLVSLAVIEIHSISQLPSGRPYKAIINTKILLLLPYNKG